jgi:uracil-xanthine permease
MVGEHMVADQRSNILYPEDSLPVAKSAIAGFQHVIAMFGGTILCPLLMGFDPNIAILCSGLSTLLFFLVVGGRIPSYLGSSFSFIAVVIAATGYSGSGPNPNIAIALGGIIATGLVYAAIGLVVLATGTRWIERLMPPVLTGAIVAVIGLNLAPVAVHDIGSGGFAIGFGLLTVALVAAASIYLPAFLARLPILIGGGIAYFAYYAACNLGEFGTPIDFSGVAAAPWFGIPHFVAPVFSASASLLIAPVAIILIAENLGHVRSIGIMMGRNLDPVLGRAFLGDGLATIFSAAVGGTGVTTYAENMGVMAITRNFSSRTFLFAAFFAVCFGLSPKFGALIQTIPQPIMGGLSMVVFGLITAAAGRIWVESRVDFTDPRNLIMVGVAVMIAAGDLTLKIGDFVLSGIGLATLASLILYHGLGLRFRPKMVTVRPPATD